MAVMPYEIDFLRAGDSNGDAIIVRWADTKESAYHLNVIDGGFTDTGDQIIDHISKYYTPTANILNVVLSHADNDHACGLIRLLEHDKFKVFNLWINRPWDYVDEVLNKFHGAYTRDRLIKKMREMHPYLVEMEQIAARKGINVCAPLQGASIGAFKVLAPSRQRYVSLIPDLDKTPTPSDTKAATLETLLGGTLRSVIEKVKERLDVETLDTNPPPTSASNETSVVQMATFGDKRILLTADVGPQGLDEAAAYAETQSLFIQPTLVQIPHHGSRRNVTPAVLDRWLGPYPASGRGYAIASVGKDQDIYPRKKVANAFTRRGYSVCATRNGWVNFVQGYDRRPGMVDTPIIPFSPDVEDDA
jgi:beta-lactamase superfamily II metal-dependent hydrolase